MPGGLQTCLHVSAHVLRSLLRMIMFLKFMLRDPYGIHYWRCLWIHAIGHELLQHKMGALVGYWLVVEGSDGMQTMDHLLSWPQVGTGTLPAFWRLYYFCPFPAIDPLSLHRNLRAPGNLIYNPLKVFWKETEKVISLSQMVPRSMLSELSEVCGVVGDDEGRGRKQLHQPGGMNMGGNRFRKMG